MYTIRLENTVTHQIYEQQVEDHNNGEKMYFRFGVSTFDLGDGEYILTLLNAEGDVLAEDLMRIGDYNPEAIQYSKGENTYIDVTLNAVLQEDKYVTINEIETRIVPDLGNDAIETVYVNAQPVYNWGYNEGYTTGYDLGQSEGYPNGYADGYDSGRTDGYNEGYDVGSMDMHLEMLEETRILNVTENGRYFTKYTEDPYIPTGDGDFSDFCKLTNTTYQMGRLKSYKEAQETGADVIEFWWRPKDLAYNHRPMILMSSAENDGNGIHHTFSINLLTYDREDKLKFHTDAGGWTSVEYIISSDPEMWYHISIQNSELYINDEFISNFYIVNDNETSYIYLNGDTRTDVEDGIDECNGYFGMVKINGEVFIPTENGYVNQNTGNIIQPIESGEYEYFKQRDPEGGLYRTVNVNIDTKQFFLNGYDEATQKIMGGVQDLTITENGQYGDGETLYKTIDVNVVPKVDIAKGGFTFAYSTIKELPAWADMSNVTSMKYMFSHTESMIDAPYIDTTKVTNWENCFWASNVKTVPNYNTENATRADGMFYSCRFLETPPTYLNLLKCENMQEMFYDVRIKDYSFLTNWDINPKANMSSMIITYDYVEYIPAIPNEGGTDYYQSGIIQSWADFSKLTYFGGYIGRKYNLTSTSVLPKCPNLTYESCISILNNLYNFVGNGETPSSSMGQMKVHPNFLTTVGDEISIGTSKGWTITA